MKYPRGVCSKGIGDNSILCGTCGKWVQKRYSGIRKRLTATDFGKFKCRICKGGGIKQGSADMKLTNDTVVERVETFCYFDDMLNSNGGCDHAVISRINKA